jgi:hypothetical protein
VEWRVKSSCGSQNLFSSLGKSDASCDFFQPLLGSEWGFFAPRYSHGRGWDGWGGGGYCYFRLKSCFPLHFVPSSASAE